MTKTMHILFTVSICIVLFASCKENYTNIKNSDLYGYWESDMNSRKFAGLEFINLLKYPKSEKWLEIDRSDKNLRIKMQFSKKDMLISVYSKSKTIASIKQGWFIDHLQTLTNGDTLRFYFINKTSFCFSKADPDDLSGICFHKID
jgi:hypothetical protein